MAFQCLQPVEQVMDIGPCRTAAGLAWNVDAVGEDNLILAVGRVLYVLVAGTLAGPGNAIGRLQVDRTQGAQGDVDVVDVVEVDGLRSKWKCDILFF